MSHPLKRSCSPASTAQSCTDTEHRSGRDVYRSWLDSGETPSTEEKEATLSKRRPRFSQAEGGQGSEMPLEARQERLITLGVISI